MVEMQKNFGTIFLLQNVDSEDGRDVLNRRDAESMRSRATFILQNVDFSEGRDVQRHRNTENLRFGMRQIHKTSIFRQQRPSLLE